MTVEPQFQQDRAAQPEAEAATILVASAMDARPGDRLDVLVHLLAQLPSHIEVHVVASDDGRLRRLARAYGIAERLRFVTSDPGRGVVVFPSPENAFAAPVRPTLGRRAIALAPPGSAIPDDVERAETFAALVSQIGPTSDGASEGAGADLLAHERVSVVTNVPAHYRIPLFNEVAQRLEAVGGEFRVHFLAQTSQTRSWMRPEEARFEHDFLRSVQLPLRENGLVVPIGVRRHLRRYKPTILVAGGFSPIVALPAAWYATVARIPFGIWSGEIGSRPTARSRARRLQRTALMRRSQFALAYGIASADYLHELSPRVPAVIVRNCPPVDPGQPHRTQSDVKEILLVGRAFPGKAMDVAVRAVRLLDRTDIRLRVVGDGPELPHLRSLAESDPRIVFSGAVPSDEVLEAFRGADVFLFPSRYDIFGHVLVEAMGSGVASIVSDAPGAVQDLAVPGWNALVVHGHDPAAWADALERVLDNDVLRASLGSRARETVRSRWTMDHAADAWIAGLRLAVLTRDS